jgi:hypothetical protein
MQSRNSCRAIFQLWFLPTRDRLFWRAQLKSSTQSGLNLPVVMVEPGDWSQLRWEAAARSYINLLSLQVLNTHFNSTHHYFYNQPIW